MKYAIVLSALIGWAGTAWAGVEVGQPAPAFTATNIHGKTLHLSDYRGKIVVMETFNPDCPFCHNQYRTGAMQALQRDMVSKGVVWLLVDSVNPNNPGYLTPQQAQKEEIKKKMTITAWIDDSSGKLGREYGMQTTPQMFVINKQGILVYDGAIDDRPSTRGNPRTAHNYVRAAVNQLLKGEKVTVAETKPYGCSVKYGR